MRNFNLIDGEVSPAAMREQTARYVAAVIKAYPFLDPNSGIEYLDPDPYPYVPRSMTAITREVAYKHGVTLAELRGRQRAKRIVAARHEAFWRCRKELGISYPRIGRFFGSRDHTTALYGVRKYEARLKELAHRFGAAEAMPHGKAA